MIKIKYFIKHLLIKYHIIKPFNKNELKKLINNTLTLEQLARRDRSYKDYFINNYIYLNRSV